jgi:hypothetical protein
LITPAGVLASIYAFTGVSTLLYGTSKFVVDPMLDSLTEARHSLHETTSQNLTKLIDMLSATVTQLPSMLNHRDLDDASSIEDPAELFHIDRGTQTSDNQINYEKYEKHLFDAPQLQDSTEPPTAAHASAIHDLVSSLEALRDGYISQSEDSADLRTTLDVLVEDVQALGKADISDYARGYSLYGRSNKPEPDDEIKRVKDSIRRVKGVLLSTRNFPSSTR